MDVMLDLVKIHLSRSALLRVLPEFRHLSDGMAWLAPLMTCMLGALCAYVAGARVAEPSGWPRLLSRSSFPEPCLPRTALTARVSRSTTLRAGLLSLRHTILAPAPDALVLAEG